MHHSRLSRWAHHDRSAYLHHEVAQASLSVVCPFLMWEHNGNLCVTREAKVRYRQQDRYVHVYIINVLSSTFPDPRFPLLKFTPLSLTQTPHYRPFIWPGMRHQIPSCWHRYYFGWHYMSCHVDRSYPYLSHSITHWSLASLSLSLSRFVLIYSRCLSRTCFRALLVSFTYKQELLLHSRDKLMIHMAREE